MADAEGGEKEEGAEGARQTRSELEMPIVRRRKVEEGVQSTASSDGRPLIVKLLRNLSAYVQQTAGTLTVGVFPQGPIVIRFADTWSILTGMGPSPLPWILPPQPSESRSAAPGAGTIPPLPLPRLSQNNQLAMPGSGGRHCSPGEWSRWASSL